DPGKFSLSGEIRWGKEARPHSRPYMAFLRFYNDKEVKVRCGGFLVRDNFVLTAAHCNGRAVKTIALPRRQDWVRPGQVCSVAGWGKLASGKMPNRLREVDLEVQDGQKCENLFKNYNNSIQLCVGNPKDKKATGSGDSGGPFVCNNVAQGIVSIAKTNGKPPQDIIQGHEPKPHSHLYMALVWFLVKERKNSSINMTLGAHNIQEQERTWQVIPVRRAIPHPEYNPDTLSNDILSLKVRKPHCCSCSPGSRLFPLPLRPVTPLLPILAP
ncbi:hypothetical protein HPG69_002227, partial [Diceros bicornis minor]